MEERELYKGEQTLEEEIQVGTKFDAHRTPPAILTRHQDDGSTFEPFRSETVTCSCEFAREAT
jgi:hypothetical protein